MQQERDISHLFSISNLSIIVNRCISVGIRLKNNEHRAHIREHATNIIFVDKTGSNIQQLTDPKEEETKTGNKTSLRMLLKKLHLFNTFISEQDISE